MSSKETRPAKAARFRTLVLATLLGATAVAVTTRGRGPAVGLSAGLVIAGDRQYSGGRVNGRLGNS
ncbi:hypothetical protein C0216_15720 [Streptomyces globosus]|uniref:Uncharacterized protein n=1 Tax=Streptomyces globosus TaxID=68209 RepID=A0A344U1D8_9ACTN|nr:MULTISPECIES: hypothetical protein [Streptomyces]AXE24709.1 hypothetical protein C0216_15720 [Streptomyces globosus]